MLPIKPKCDSSFSYNIHLVGQPEGGPVRQVLKDRVNEQQTLMNSSPLETERFLSFSGDRLQSPDDLAWQARKTNSVALYHDENSPLLLNEEPFGLTGDIEHYMHAASEAGFLPKYISAVNELFKMGKIDCGQAYELLNAPDAEFIFRLFSARSADDSTLLHNPEVFKVSIPILETLSPATFYDLLTIKNYRLLIPLDDQRVFEMAMPLLEAWDRSMLDRMFAFLTSRLCRPFSLLRHPNAIQAATSLFKKVSPEVAAKFFCVLVSCGSSFCQRETPWIEVMPFFKDLDPKLVVRIFKALAEQGIWFYPWQHSAIFAAGIPVLEALKTEPEALVEFLSILNDKGLSILHYPKIFDAAIPFLKGLPSDLLVRIFSVCAPDGWALLDYFYVFKAAIPLFEALKAENRWEDVVSILSILNEKNETCLFDTTGLRTAIPFLMTLETDELVQIFSIQDAGGNPLLMNEWMYQELIPFFKTLPQDVLIRIFSIADADGLIPLNDPDVFEAMIPFLKDLPLDLQVGLISIANAEGAISLNDPEVFAVALPWLRMLDEEALLAILSISNGLGRTPFSYNEVFALALPFLEKLDDETLVKILSIADEEGWTPLDFSLVFEAAIPLLENLKSGNKWDVVVRILSILNTNQTTCLFNRPVFSAAIPFLQTLETDELLEIFSIKDAAGCEIIKDGMDVIEEREPIPFMMYPRMWEVMIPYFKTLDSEVLIKLLSILSHYKSSVHYPEVWEKAKPFIDQLDMEVRCRLPIWKDVQYKTLMGRQLTG